MMSSAGPANARPLRARVALHATIVGISFIPGLLQWTLEKSCAITNATASRDVKRFCTRGRSSFDVIGVFPVPRRSHSRMTGTNLRYRATGVGGARRQENDDGRARTSLL